jgi:hypothetical protein
MITITLGHTTLLLDNKVFCHLQEITVAEHQAGKVGL